MTSRRNEVGRITHLHLRRSQQARSDGRTIKTITAAGIDSAVDYVYDMFNRRIETITDSNGDGTPNAYEFYIYDGDNIAMDFLDPDGPTRTENGETVGTASPKLENRYLWGFNVDELLAQDHYTSSTANGTYWTIQDRQNSIRDAVGGDLIIYNWHSTSYTDFGATVAVSGRTFNNTLPSYFRFTYTCQEREKSTAAFSSILVFRNRVYDVNTAKFLQQDPSGLAPDINPYRYCHNDPINFIDPMGLWGADVHNDKTKTWAENVGFNDWAASAIAQFDEATDGMLRGKSPFPVFGDQDYHFNGNRIGNDTRDQIVSTYIADAKYLASNTPTAGNSVVQKDIAQRLGIALHAKQDWVAHADYGYLTPRGQEIYITHNSRSPQNIFGDPGGYPDDIRLDVMKSPDGRATWQYLTATWGFSYKGGLIQFTEYACYMRGSKRIDLTEKVTKAILQDFKNYLLQSATADIKHYFIKGG